MPELRIMNERMKACAHANFAKLGERERVEGVNRRRTRVRRSDRISLGVCLSVQTDRRLLQCLFVFRRNMMPLATHDVWCVQLRMGMLFHTDTTCVFSLFSMKSVGQIPSNGAGPPQPPEPTRSPGCIV